MTDGLEGEQRCSGREFQMTDFCAVIFVISSNIVLIPTRCITDRMISHFVTYVTQGHASNVEDLCRRSQAVSDRHFNQSSQETSSLYLRAYILLCVYDSQYSKPRRCVSVSHCVVHCL